MNREQAPTLLGFVSPTSNHPEIWHRKERPPRQICETRCACACLACRLDAAGTRHDCVTRSF
eukprot:10815164-Alexandrium_andersonii.AAC.1